VLSGVVGRVGGVFKSRSAGAFKSAGSEAAEEESSSEGAPSAIVFRERVQFAGGEMVLFDSKRDADHLPASATLTSLAVRYSDGAPKADALQADLALWLFVDDMVTPRAKVRLVDLVRQGGTRPLNIRRQAGQVVRIVLVDPQEAWKGTAVRMEVELAW
jgi:hypothetical protein